MLERFGCVWVELLRRAASFAKRLNVAMAVVVVVVVVGIHCTDNPFWSVGEARARIGG